MIYVKSEDGVVGRITDGELPKGLKKITEKQYKAHLEKSAKKMSEGS